jgi:undecaprenyl pyrophosphate synthase
MTSEPMHSQVQYYVIVAGHGSRAASGLARRRYAQAGPVDETLRRDLSWQADSAIVEWEYGDLDTELIKISEQEAENLTQAFRARLERAT